MESLWPKLEEVAMNVPYKILQEQTDAFNEQMQGALVCTLEKDKYKSKGFISIENYDFCARMYISSPNLADYRLQLLVVNFSIAKAYPCTVENCLDEYVGDKKAENSEEFKSILKEIFHSKKVIDALNNIVAQSLL